MVANIRLALGLSLGLFLLTGVARADAKKSSLQSGKPDLKSVGPLAFGPNGILFVGDPQGAAIFAIETGDTAATSAGAFKVEGIGEKIAGAIGVDAKQMMITDMAVNPISGNAYLGVSRMARGPDAIPVIVQSRCQSSGKRSELLGGSTMSDLPRPNWPRLPKARTPSRKSNTSRAGFTSPGFPMKRSPPNCVPFPSPSKAATWEPAWRFITVRMAKSKPNRRSELSPHSISMAKRICLPPIPARRWWAFRFSSTEARRKHQGNDRSRAGKYESPASTWWSIKKMARTLC